VSLQLVYQKVGSNITNLVRNKGNATLTGGVGGDWAEESNYQTLLGVKAPVIAEVTDNLLADLPSGTQNTSYEDNDTRGNITNPGGVYTFEVTEEWAVHGAKSLKVTRTGAADDSPYFDIVSITNPDQTYTASARLKPTTNDMRITLWDNVSGTTAGNTIPVGSEGYSVVTKTFDASSTARRFYIAYVTGGYPRIHYQDVLQLEQKSYATPFALDSRTATTCKFSTADLGLTAGQDLSIVVCLKPVYDGDDSVAHTLFDCQGTDATHNRILIQKDASNNLNFNIWDNAGNLKQCVEAVDGTDWPADTELIIICNRSSSGTMDAYLAGTQFGTVDSGAGTGLESTLGIYAYLGSDNAGNNHINAPILVAIFDRVLSPLEIQRISDMKTDKQSWLSPNFIENLSRLGGCVISPQVAPLSGIDELHYIA